MIFLWACACLYFSPRILAMLIGPEDVFAKISIIIFAILLNLFWFYGFYHFVIIMFSYITKPADLSPENCFKGTPQVALLYATRDDFREDAVLSCLSQDYTNVRVFILDDSDTPEYQGKIDAWSAHYKNKVTVIRRKDRVGYKAGNINNCLRNISGVEFFSISDSDTILPKDYITRLLPFFCDKSIAFVQARQELNPRQKEAFARELGYQIGFHCDRYLSVKNKYGFVMFYGHAALMRVDVWKKIGGFPEVATEDLAYSLAVRQLGYKGIYTPEVTCYEDFPATYRQYRRRNEKWIRGTTECLLKFYPAFARNPRVTSIEKLDVFVSAASLLLAMPFSLFLFL
ncbi:MAG: glycosyltransferase, partial [Victivallales bacterium]|nr:glycosyltransferase [Victivallales bacterium]